MGTVKDSVGTLSMCVCVVTLFTGELITSMFIFISSFCIYMLAELNEVKGRREKPEQEKKKEYKFIPSHEFQQAEVRVQVQYDS
jgi:hypothetical protein